MCRKNSILFRKTLPIRPKLSLDWLYKRCVLFFKLLRHHKTDTATILYYYCPFRWIIHFLKLHFLKLNDPDPAIHRAFRVHLQECGNKFRPRRKSLLQSLFIGYILQPLHPNARHPQEYSCRLFRHMD